MEPALVRPWADALYDPTVGLLWNPPGSFDDEGVPPRSVHLVPQSAWYALDLAARGDSDGVARVVDAILALQYRAEGTPWHGTFARVAEAPEPSSGAVEWVDYDPNWRQFCGISLALLLRHHRSLLDPGRVQRIEDAIALAVAGEQAAGRLAWHYTNIALQHAWLLVEAGETDAGHGLASLVADRWRRRRTFPEFNSPTYDGVDLWALALWRGHAATEELRALGAELEAGHWRTVAARYHAGLGNLAGPYTRAYGLDLHRYVAKVALLFDGPHPPLEGTVAHGHDLLSLPALRLAPPAIPADAFGNGDRLVHDVITARPMRREATAWLGDDVAVGAEDGEADWAGWFQFVAGTVHWRRPDGAVGVLRYVPDGPPHGRAEPGVLRVGGPGHVEVHDPEPPGVVHTTRSPGRVLELGRTALPGLDVDVRADGDGFVVELG
jgi:hypothetical protein